MNALGTIKKLLAGATAATRDLTLAIDQLRAKRLVVLDEIDRIGGLPIPMDQAFAAITRDLDRMVEGARDTVYTPALLRSSAPRLQAPTTEGMIGLLVTSNRDEFEKTIRSIVAAEYDGIDVMEPAARVDALTALAADLAGLERAEEALIRAAEREGLSLMRREDADPDVLLLADEDLE